MQMINIYISKNEFFPLPNENSSSKNRCDSTLPVRTSHVR